MNSLMDHMQMLLDIPDDEVTVDELNQLVTCVGKLDKVVTRMGETRMLQLKNKRKDDDGDWWR